MGIGDWFWTVTGLDNQDSRWYAFWSGIGGDLTELAVLAGAFTFVRRHNCHVPRCWRLGRYSVPNTPWVVCAVHKDLSA